MKNRWKSNIIKSNAAFTLIELMVVIGIIAIMSAIAIPNLMNPEHKLKKAATGLMSDMQKTRSMAIKENKEWRIVFDATGYSIFTDTINPGPPPVKTPVEKKRVDLSGYAAGVEYGHGSATKDVSGDSSFPAVHTYTDNTLAFTPKGTVNTTSGTGEMYVYLEYGDATYAVGTGPTGIVKILRWDGGAWK
ncbi:MAG: GspH/FimT family protein [Desulfamplus sp.]|nr:GspH/FimT family protein [Desulfamplus sp.]